MMTEHDKESDKVELTKNGIELNELNSLRETQCRNYGSDEFAQSQYTNFKEECKKLPLKSYILAIFNMMHAILGSGIIGMPFALKLSGYGLFVISTAFATFASSFSLIILIKLANDFGVNTYQEVSRYALGNIGWYFSSFVQLCFPFVATVSYNVIVGDTLVRLFKRVLNNDNTLLTNRYFVSTLSCLLIALPLSLYHNVQKFGKWSIIATSGIVFLAVFAVVENFTFPEKFDVNWYFGHVGFPEGFAIVCHSITCQHNAFSIYNSLKQRNESAWIVICIIATVMAGVLLMIFGFVGYSITGSWTEGHFLNNFCYHDTLANVARFIFMLDILMESPFECFAGREVVQNNLRKILSRPIEVSPPFWEHIVISCLFIILSLIVSFSTTCLSIVLDVSGGIFAVIVCFILPNICYIVTNKLGLRHWSNILPLIFLIIGFAIVIKTIVNVIRQIISDVKCHGDTDMFYCVNKTFIYTNFSVTHT